MQFITNVPQNRPIKKFENRSIFGEDIDKSLRLTSFGHRLFILDLNYC